MRLRTILFLVVATLVVYRLLPASRKRAFRERMTALGQALVLSIVLFWCWMLLTMAWNAWRG